MTVIQDLDTITPSRTLPAELQRIVSSSHESDEPKLACMVSGMASTGHEDEVICPLMLRRNLVVPAHRGTMAQSAWRVA